MADEQLIADSTSDILWLPMGVFKRKPKPGLSMTYAGGVHVTFSKALADLLDGRRINFGVSDRVYFKIVTDPDGEGWLVRNGQASGRVLRKYLPPEKVVLYFKFDESQGLFAETDRVL